MTLPIRAVFVTVCLMTGGLCWANELPVSAILACRNVADDVSRLACFDKEAAALAGAGKPATNSVPSAARGTPSTPAPASSASRSAAEATSSTPVPPSTPAAVASPPVSSAPPAAAAALDPRRTFGLDSGAIKEREVAAGIRPKDLTSVSAHISRISPSANGRLVFTLDNDQVWQQLLADGDLSAKPGDGVTISRGMLGSYWLQASTGRGCKVRRVR